MKTNYQYSFERLEDWKLSRKLVKQVYQLCKKLPKDEIFGLISQTKRASVSIPTNLAEGSTRSSLKERKHFYEISYGSMVELLNLMIIAEDLGYITKDEFLKVREEIQVLSNVMNALSKALCATN